MQWQWKLSGGWRDYEAEQSTELEAAFSRGENSCSLMVWLMAGSEGLGNGVLFGCS